MDWRVRTWDCANGTRRLNFVLLDINHARSSMRRLQRGRPTTCPAWLSVKLLQHCTPPQTLPYTPLAGATNRLKGDRKGTRKRCINMGAEVVLLCCPLAYPRDTNSGPCRDNEGPNLFMTNPSHSAPPYSYPWTGPVGKYCDAQGMSATEGTLTARLQGDLDRE